MSTLLLHLQHIGDSLKFPLRRVMDKALIVSNDPLAIKVLDLLPMFANHDLLLSPSWEPFTLRPAVSSRPLKGSICPPSTVWMQILTPLVMTELERDTASLIALNERRVPRYA